MARRPRPRDCRRRRLLTRTGDPGEIRLHGFVSKPEIQKLNRNSIYIFVNGRLIRDRLVQHALTEAYRNILPPTVFPVVLLFLEMPTEEVDVNVHPSKTEVRFRQQSCPARFHSRLGARGADEGASGAAVLAEINAQPTAGPSLSPGTRGATTVRRARGRLVRRADESPAASLSRPPSRRPLASAFNSKEESRSKRNAAVSLARTRRSHPRQRMRPGSLPTNPMSPANSRLR